MADEILLKFAADITSYEQAIDRVEQKTLGLDKAVKDVGRTTKEVGKGNTFAALNKGFKETQQEANKTSRAIKETGKESEKTGKVAVSGFVKLRNELKLVKGQMAELAVAGKEGTEEFKKLQIQAGQLQDTMKDLGTSIQLNAGDPLENLTSSFGSVRGSISSLDFDGLSRGLGSMASNINRVDLKTFKEGLGGVATNFGKIAGALITNPLFLVGAAVALIIAKIVTWGDSMEEIAAKNDKAADKIIDKLDLTTAAYDRQIKVLAATGKSTDKLEDERLRAIVKASNETIALRKKELKDFKDVKETESVLQNTVSAKFLARQKELNEKLVEAEEQKSDAIADLQVLVNEREKAGDDKAQADAEAAAEKAKAFAEKRRAEIEAAQKALTQSEINLLEDGQRKQRQQINFEFQQRIEAIKGNSDIEIALRESLIRERDAKLEKVEEESREKKINLIRKEGKDLARELKQITNEELEIIQTGAKTLDEFNAIQRATRAEELNQDLQAKIAFANSVVDIGQAAATLLSDNAEDAAEKNKLFAAFGIGLNLASTLGNMIAGASAAAAATGPLAPFTLVSYIASGLATVLGAFAQVKTLLNAPVPKGAAEGEEWVHGKQYGKDTEPYMLAHGERVVTSAVNEKYWDVLHAMHTGNEKAILPALRKALGVKADEREQSFANNIAGSLLMNRGNWKGNNIVEALGLINKQDEKRHHEMMLAIKPRSTNRKK